MVRSSKPVAEIRRRIREVPENRGFELVRAYYAPNSGFAGSMFDSFGNNPVGEFTSDDLVAASLLDVRFGPAAVQELLIKRQADALLREIPNDAKVTLWNTGLPRESAAWRLWEVLVGIDGVGPTRASKLMARKRPHLVPILDSVINERLGLGDRDRWRVLGEALDDQTRIVVDQLREAADGHAPSTLRLLDVATWMRFSESGRARNVREALDLEDSRPLEITDEEIKP
jgi:hypothetical protein